MRFYEFEKEFDYYALIAAETTKEAKSLYSEVVADLEDGEPEEITLEQTKEKLIISCENNRQRREELLTFAINMLNERAFLVLIDGGLL